MASQSMSLDLLARDQSTQTTTATVALEAPVLLGALAWLAHHCSPSVNSDSAAIRAENGSSAALRAANSSIAFSLVSVANE